MSRSEEMIALLNDAYEEGYKEGCSDTIKNLPKTPATEEESEIPRHDITNAAVAEFLKNVPENGYSQSDKSRLIPHVFKIQERDEPSWTESINPYIVQGDGDKVTLSDGKTSVDYTPYLGTFRLTDLLPDKTYNWTMKKSGKEISRGQFKTYGVVRMVAFDDMTNVRDLYVPNYIKAGVLYRGANPDSIKVNSDDHKLLKRLGITTQIDLRGNSARKDLFSNPYSFSVADYASVLTSTTNIKNVFTTLATSLSKGEKILINCKSGADRTGTICYLIQALCGVPQGILEAHWELTSMGRWCNFKLWNYERSSFAKGEMRSFVAAISKLYGANPYTHAYKYLTEKCGVSKTTIDTIVKALK